MESSNITGPLALGYMVGFIFFGVLVLQSSFYNTRFCKDPASFKALVWGVLVLETVATALSSVGAWDSFGTNWGNLDSLQVMHWSWLVVPLVDGLIAPAVQSFFAWRIFKFTNKIWMLILILILSFLQLFATFYASIGTLAHGRTAEKLQSYALFITLGLASSFACNTLIATVIITTTLLRSSLNMPPYQLFGLVMESNALNAFGSLIQLILWLTMPYNNFHYMFFLILGRLYANVLLVALNSRVQYSADYSGHIVASRDGATLWADVSRPNGTVVGNANKTRRNSVGPGAAKIVAMYSTHDMHKPSAPTYSTHKHDPRVLRFDDASV